MGDEVRLDGDGLRALAQHCDTVAVRLTSVTAAPVAGPSFLLTAEAVAVGHARIKTAAAALAARATATAGKLRTAASLYSTDDDQSAHRIAARANTMHI